MNNNETFNYSYDAKRQAEIKKIREKYLPKEPDKMARLRQLDNSVTKKSTIYSLVLGIAGTLILGVGMCCCLVWTKLFILGIVTGIIGIAILGFAYPVYLYVTKIEKERIAPEILRLTEELME